MKLETAVEKIKNDPAMKKKFLANPKAELNALGVDTSQVTINEAKGSKGSVCHSLGIVTCYTTGF